MKKWNERFLTNWIEDRAERGWGGHTLRNISQDGGTSPPPPPPPPPKGAETNLCRAVWGGGCAGRAVGREWWAWAEVAPLAVPATGPRGGGRRVGPGGVAWAARRLWACSEVRRTEGSRPRACQHDHSHRPAPSSRHRSAGTRRPQVTLRLCF